MNLTPVSYCSTPPLHSMERGLGGEVLAANDPSPDRSLNFQTRSSPENSKLGTRNSELKIGLLVGDLAPADGWSHYSLSLVEALRGAGADVTVIAARTSPDVTGLTQHRLLPDLRHERGILLRQMAALPAARAALRGCDVIHAALEPYAPLAALAAGRRPLFITGHGTYVQLPLLRRWPASALYRQAFRRGTLVCVSRYTAAVAARAVPGLTTVVINTGVDVARFMALPPSPPTPLPQGEGGEEKIVLAVGAVKARKGILELVRALAVVRQQMPDVRGVVIGSLDDTAYVERVRAEIARLNLQNTVRLLGKVPDDTLLAWYGAARVFVLPAITDGWKFEGYGLVYLEAGAAGLPVIGTRDSGAADAIDDGVTGLLVAPERLETDLPPAILRLLRDPALAARLGAAGRAKAQAQTWALVARRLLALYAGSR